jgi:hypothetical protein
MKKLFAGVIGAIFAAVLLTAGVGCDSKATTKTTETKDTAAHKSTEVKEAPK